MSPGQEHLPAIHILHAQHYVTSFILESTVESDDIGAVAIMPDL
jgi:hypothetical protein